MEKGQELFSVEWNGLEPLPEQKDAYFFRYDEHNSFVASVSLTKDGETYTTNIYIDGEMRLVIPYLNEDGTWDSTNCDYVRYADDLERYAKTDKELDELFSAWNERGEDIWVHNPWFDLYTEDGEHLDAVTHTIDEAVEQAKAVLLEVASKGGWENYL